MDFREINISVNTGTTYFERHRFLYYLLFALTIAALGLSIFTGKAFFQPLADQFGIPIELLICISVGIDLCILVLLAISVRSWFVFDSRDVLTISMLVVFLIVKAAILIEATHNRVSNNTEKHEIQNDSLQNNLMASVSLLGGDTTTKEKKLNNEKRIVQGKQADAKKAENLAEHSGNILKLTDKLDEKTEEKTEKEKQKGGKNQTILIVLELIMFFTHFASSLISTRKELDTLETMDCSNFNTTAPLSYDQQLAIRKQYSSAYKAIKDMEAANKVPTQAQKDLLESKIALLKKHNIPIPQTKP